MVDVTDDAERAAFRAYMKRDQRKRRLLQYAEEIPLFEALLPLVEAREDMVYARRLRKQIAHRRQRLESGWPDEA